jgi:hypothetical protein
MLRKQLEGWLALDPRLAKHLLVILIDDCSPVKPASEVLNGVNFNDLDFRLYRVKVDIPWNQHGCRNLGAMEAPDGWMFMSDIDHVLPERSIEEIVNMKLDPGGFYTLQRVTAVKKEDGNLKYDLMTDAFGKLKPHPNTFLITRKQYWGAGGYDEDYCGTYGGDGPFTKTLDRRLTRIHLPDLYLIRWTRDLIPDASQPPEYREKYRTMYRMKFASKGGGKANGPTKPIRFAWERLI